MKRIVYLLVTITFIFILLFTIAPSVRKLVQAATNEQAVTNFVGIPTSRTNSSSKIQTTTQGIYGPQICTAYGDPFSPWNSPWEPNSYTYRYQIRIPNSYDQDVVRVELFDPDSVNQIENQHTVAYSANALTHPTNPINLPTTRFCGSDGGSSERKNPCVLQTYELALTQPSVTPTYSLDHINPFWFVRVDENRGAGGGQGNGTCGVPASYTVRYNTQTLFELYYFQDDGNGSVAEVPLASYTGNTGDVRDVNGFHHTDMHWVSPGADHQGFDFPPIASGLADTPGVSEVPTNEGNTSFEVDLTSDTLNIIIDPDTGARILYLDITSLSGASENVFEIWAGPATYVNTEASNVNLRNLRATNVPGSHDANGIQIEAIGRLPINNLYANPTEWPLIAIAAEAAGETFTVSIFDMGSGAEGPITFYFDTVPESYWSLTFGIPSVDDPDGVTAGTRCEIGSCNNEWITPPYGMTVPGDLSNCDPLNPTQADCTPFFGGRLMARVDGGEHDTSVWQINPVVPGAHDTTQSCAAFPIAVGSAVRSATAPGTGATPYPDAGDFDYPASPPSFFNFPSHIKNVDLASARAGTLFVLELGVSSTEFGWLKWNMGIAGDEAVILSNSLTWPGDSFDYSDHGDVGSHAADAFPHVVRGYVKPGDATDTSLRVDDWVIPSVAQLPGISSAMQTLIDDAPVLRLIVQDEDVNAPASSFSIEQFGLFKLHGYGNSNLDNEWLLLEFIGFDNSCGQPVVIPDPTATPTSTATSTPTTTPTPASTPTVTPTPVDVEIYLPLIRKDPTGIDLLP